MTDFVKSKDTEIIVKHMAVTLTIVETFEYSSVTLEVNVADF